MSTNSGILKVYSFDIIDNLAPDFKFAGITQCPCNWHHPERVLLPPD